MADIAEFPSAGYPQEVHHVVPTYENDSQLRQWTDEQAEIAAAQPVEFRLTSPSIDVLTVATVVPPKPDECCSVYLNSFTSELRCLRLNTCSHAFCEECLNSFVNEKYPQLDSVPCPYCREAVCPWREIELEE